MKAWKRVVLAVLCAGIGVFVAVARQRVRDEYAQLAELIAPLDVDGYTGEAASLARQAQVVVLDRLTGASAFSSGEDVTRELEWVPSTAMEGLRVTKLSTTKKSRSSMAGVNGRNALVVGTIRMGFGHHRIAYAACSWALSSSAPAKSKDKPFSFKGGVYFHDVLAIDGPESALIRDSDTVYRTSSKLATELGGPFEWAHALATRSGDATSLRSTALVAARLAPLMRGLPKNCALVASHSLVALAASLAGITDRVLNLVIDNHPQWFVVAPKALNLVQGPRNYLGFFAKRSAADDVRLAGHWIPRDNVRFAADDAQKRQRRNGKKPALRVLVPVGGAGAQRSFITGLVEGLEEDVRRGDVALILNAGDHDDVRDALSTALADAGFLTDSDVHSVSTLEDARTLADTLLLDESSNATSIPPVTLCAFEDYFAAVAATDILSRGVDVLACKPSELAFYPVPKLMIRRVGDHEAYSASRANELGDGTAEVRTVAEALLYLRLFAQHRAALDVMNDAIQRNAQAGLYDGAKTALAIAAGALK